MTLTVLIVLFIIALLLIFFIVRFFDVVLIKDVVKRINEEGPIGKKELADSIKRFFENRSLNTAHKLYIGAVTTIVGGNSLFSFVRGIITFQDENNVFQLDLLYDNGLSNWLILVALVLITAGYYFFLYSRTKRYKADILSKAAAIINDTLNFTPNQDWFKQKTNKAIDDLGKAIDLSINFTYEHFEEAFASTCRDSRISKVFSEDVRSLYSDFMRERRALADKIGEDDVQKIEDVIIEIKNLLNKSKYDGSEPTDVIRDVGEIDHILSSAIRTNKLSYSDYLYTKIHSAISKIQERIENPWIQSIKNQAFIIYGKGGCGKTHLLAKLADTRIAAGLPTVLFLGKLITDTENPFSQILKLLDIHCTKEIFLKSLNEYGRKHGRALLIIDGINEGKGLSLWRQHLLSFINEFKPYDNISLIVSVRVNSNSNWFSTFIRDEKFPSYRHDGFERNMVGAIEYMFRSFRVPLPSWPIYQREFTNPLLLTLYCRSHAGEKNPPKFESRLEIIQNYVKKFNERLSEKFGYSAQTPVLQLALASMGNSIAESESRRFLGRERIIKLFSKIRGIPKDKGLFIDALVDEGLLNEYESSGKIFYSFGYDTIGAYITGESLAKDASYDKLINNSESVLEALTDLIPQYRRKEFFELASGDSDMSGYLVELFLNGLPSRKNLTSGGIEYLQRLIDEQKYYDIFSVAINNSFRTDLPVSIKLLDSILSPLTMVQRDEIWTQVISDYGDFSESLLQLSQWGWSASPSVLRSVKQENLRNLVHLLAWTLSSTYIELRDKASRALINILKTNRVLLIDLINNFGGINDPYITERVYAVAFGCCTGNATIDYVKPVAQLVYDIIFRNDNVPEHILIRDYAKCIIDYSVHMDCRIDFTPELVSPPYCLKKKNLYVETKEIKKYQLPYSEGVDKQLVTSQNNILDSMCTEHSSRGMYGDFGRYVFQSAIDNWNDNVELISNYGIKMIFEEYGYDANVFKGFDGRHSSWERHGNKIERIGKKYEWLALYRIAAILDDNHYGEEFESDWKTPTLYHLRRFDPTILMNPDTRDYTTPLPKYRVPEYDMSADNDVNWMMSWKKMPPISQYLDYKNPDNNWICLYSYYTVSSISSEKKQLPAERELWSFVQAFLVDEKNRKAFCNIIDKEGLSGRDGSENREASYSYYREYYWSESYKTQIESQGYTEREYNIGHQETNYKVQPSYLLYDISEYADASITDSREMILPSPFLFNGLNLHFSVTDGVWLAPDGSVACFDSYWIYGGHAGLFIRKDLLLKYLKENKKSIVWPYLMERMYKTAGTYWPRIQAGGYVWLDDDGKLHKKFRCYEPTHFDKAVSKIRSYVSKFINRNKKKLVEKGLIKVPLEEYLSILSEIDEDKVRE